MKSFVKYSLFISLIALEIVVPVATLMHHHEEIGPRAGLSFSQHGSKEIHRNIAGNGECNLCRNEFFHSLSVSNPLPAILCEFYVITQPYAGRSNFLHLFSSSAKRGPPTFLS